MYCDKYKRNCYADSDLTFLVDISNTISHGTDLDRDLEVVMKKLCEFLGAKRGAITIIDQDNETIMINAAYGLTEEEKRRGVYKIGEGITGKVVETGHPVIIRDITTNDHFLNKTGVIIKAGEIVAFLCVPVIMKNEVRGTLSIHKIHTGNIDFNAEIKFLSIIGMLIGQNVSARSRQIEELNQLRAENRHLKNGTSNRPENIIGNTAIMRNLYDLIEKVAPKNTTVMIRGESGVGKELIAEAIHNASRRADKPFIKINCSAFPENLIESELFGHEKGSFTGATNQHIGKFEMANKGTLFLDEIGELSPAIQVKLLRVIQQRQIERIGGTKPIDIDVRIITATNRNLEQLIKDNLFREDLYYRLNVFPIYVPALRERTADIPMLTDYFIVKINKKNGTKVKRITGSALDMLMTYSWPGNIRELENVIERAMILSADGVIHSYDLPPTLQTGVSSNTMHKGTLHIILDKVEKQMIIDTLILTKGNISKAAIQLGITERVLGLRIAKYNLEIQKYKNSYKQETS